MAYKFEKFSLASARYWNCSDYSLTSTDCRGPILISMFSISIAAQWRQKMLHKSGKRAMILANSSDFWIAQFFFAKFRWVVWEGQCNGSLSLAATPVQPLPPNSPPPLLHSNFVFSSGRAVPLRKTPSLWKLVLFIASAVRKRISRRGRRQDNGKTLWAEWQRLDQGGTKYTYSPPTLVQWSHHRGWGGGNQNSFSDGRETESRDS